MLSDVSVEIDVLATCLLTLRLFPAIVEKHVRFAFYHASAEAFASMLTDMPYKVRLASLKVPGSLILLFQILNSIIFNVTLYFMTNLRREAGPFFFFYLIS